MILLSLITQIDMTFKKGNNFWTTRSKHGRDKIFKTADQLWEAACEYFDHVDQNPFLIEKKTTNSKEETTQEEYRKKPYTLMGLCLYCGANSEYWREFRRTASKDFSSVIKQIEEIIYTQKFAGASAGLFNANIIARDLGLSDKSEINQNTVIRNPYEGLTEEELRSLAYGKDKDDLEGDADQQA